MPRQAAHPSCMYIEDLTDEFVEDYVIPTMQAGVDYEGYLLGTSFARPILAKRVVEIARAEGADAVCHGSTGKGNDQVRFELAITFGELVYDGQWFSPLRKALSAFVTSYYKRVVFIDRSPAGCYNNYRVLWIGLYHLPSNGFAEAPTTASLLKC